ncbi:hypothetical protein BRC19_03305 [Candidatus Saccharibacteria bacterium QS_5_54_17]|nr:MAG: hypothetical protein BRC19_03305 [Candidatus Saccharibacteria bacterium QS_5_54_17]
MALALSPHLNYDDVLDKGIRDNKVETGISETARNLKEEFDTTEAHYEKPITRTTLRTRFYNLAATWEHETMHLSDIHKKSLHPAYQEIIGMGEDALPFIFEEFKKATRDWFWALNAITGIDPIPKDVRGDKEAMARIWLEWGRTHGYVR